MRSSAVAVNSVVNEDIVIKTTHILEAIAFYDGLSGLKRRFIVEAPEIKTLRVFAARIAGAGERCLTEEETKELIQILNNSTAQPGSLTLQTLNKIREAEANGKTFKAFADVARLIHLADQFLLNNEKFSLLYQRAEFAQSFKSWIDEFMLRGMSVMQYFPIILQNPAGHAAFFLLYDSLALKMDPSALQQFVPKLLPNAKYARGLLTILGRIPSDGKILSSELDSLLRQIEQLQKIERALPDNLKDNIVRFVGEPESSKNVALLIEYMQECKIAISADRLEKMIKYASNAKRAVGMMNYLEVVDASTRLFRIDLPTDQLFDLALEFPDEIMKLNAEWLNEKCGRDVVSAPSAPQRKVSLRQAQALFQPSTSAPAGSSGGDVLVGRKESIQSSSVPAETQGSEMLDQRSGLQHSGPH